MRKEEKKNLGCDSSQPTVVTTPAKMPKRKVAALEKVEADLVNLQYKIRRDPK